MTFEYVEEIVSIYPPYADYEGGDLITISGLGFRDEAYTCTFVKQDQNKSFESLGISPRWC